VWRIAHLSKHYQVIMTEQVPFLLNYLIGVANPRPSLLNANSHPN
jgi:hypothetical protein